MIYISRKNKLFFVTIMNIMLLYNTYNFYVNDNYINPYFIVLLVLSLLYNIFLLIFYRLIISIDTKLHIKSDNRLGLELFLIKGVYSKCFFDFPFKEDITISKGILQFTFKQHCFEENEDYKKFRDFLDKNVIANG